ncbi:MAG: hypothetical protein Q9169_007719, partial [Polycauliona sp. 2 TL-2023]
MSATTSHMEKKPAALNWTLMTSQALAGNRALPKKEKKLADADIALKDERTLKSLIRDKAFDAI